MLEGVERFADSIDKLSKKLDGIGRIPKTHYYVLGLVLFLMGGGCVAYIDFRQREFDARAAARQEAFERKMKASIDAMTLNLRQVMEMWKDDPKNFDKTGKQIEEIRDWIRTHR